MIYFCCSEKRRSAVRDYKAGAGDDINGIDYLEVVDRDEPVLAMRQRVLHVHFVREPGEPLLTNLGSIGTKNVRITGGERITNIVVTAVAFTTDKYLKVEVSAAGDFSTYTLSLIDEGGDPFGGLDPALSSVDFSFKAECPSPFDCAEGCACHTETPPAPNIDYLAKDYASFRQLMLDRMSVLAPAWRERNAADLGIALVELLAYAGDYLSYRQDAVGTEAYLGTARQRVSVRRHARLLDYAMHDGCNARAWVHVRLKPMAPDSLDVPRFLIQDGSGAWKGADAPPLPGSGIAFRPTRFATRIGDSAVAQDTDFERLVAQYRPQVFEPMHSTKLFKAHNELRFYTWSDDECCLPKGATKATMVGELPNLRRGDVLVLMEKRGPRTGSEADADPRRRHGVRLTDVKESVDKLTTQPITEITWAAADALPFALYVSRVTDDHRIAADVSVALGNIILADHGLTQFSVEDLRSVPTPNPVLAPVSGDHCGSCGDEERRVTPPRFRPRLDGSPLTQGGTVSRAGVVDGRRTRLAFDPGGSAMSAFEWDMEHVVPAVRLGDDRGGSWSPRTDLLSSDAFAPEFTVETENNGMASIRFGDDENGMRPGEGMRFRAHYRVGNGASGNVGAEAIVHFIGGTAEHEEWIESVTNPMPARGGVDPETLEHVRQSAPTAFRVPKRAVTPADYAMMTEKHAEVQRAAATLRWTGSWYTMFLTVDRIAGRPIDDAFEQELRSHLEQFRLAGHDLEIDGPRYVALDVEMIVCVEPHYFRSDVLAALQRAFASGTQPDGTRGFFHPDNFTFGQGVYLSQLYATAQKVVGVRHAEVKTLQRLGTPNDTALTDGVLRIGRLEIARLDNDPNFRDRGMLTFQMSGGR